MAKLDDPLDELVEIGNRNCRRLSRLIDDILDFEKIEAGKLDYSMEPVDLVALVTESLEAVSGLSAKYGVAFEIASAPNTPVEVTVDSFRILQVMANLLSNAAKFCRDGGPVTVSVATDGDTATVSVADNGPGIRAEFRPQLFTPFTQADQSDARERQGSGLGLSICHSILRDHHGEITFETKIDVGTVFRISLPRNTSSTMVDEAVQPRAVGA